MAYTVSLPMPSLAATVSFTPSLSQTRTAQHSIDHDLEHHSIGNSRQRLIGRIKKLRRQVEGAKGEWRVFATFDEVGLARDLGQVDLPAMVDVQVTPQDFLMDLGSGDGRTVITAAKRGARDYGIEYNPDTQVADILPAIQNELKTHDIESRIYEISGILDQCPIWLKYSAYMEWDTPPFSSTYQPFMSRAMFTLQRSNGEIIGSSGYELGAELQMGKWSGTRNKIARAIHALVKGEIKTAQNTTNGAQP